MKIDTYRDLQSQGTNPKDKFSILRMVEINPTELCNRRCSFCPRSNRLVYRNKNKHIDIETIENLSYGLKEINFNNRLGFVGFGEPLLCKTIFESIKTVNSILPNLQWLEVNTNGDKLTTDNIEKLYNAGCTHITISMYDSDKSEYFESLKKDIPVELVFRHHYDPSVNYNLNIVNRSELLKNKNKIYNNNACFLPFYKAMIDWNGDVLLCNNDWSRKNKFGNVNKDKFKNIWFGKELNNFRKKLLIERKSCNPCKNCSINGKLRGIDSVEIFSNYYSG